MSGALIMLLALTIDAAIGWPLALYARIGHPVTWIGAAIARLDRALNIEGVSDFARRAAGSVTAVGIISVAAGSAWITATFLPRATATTCWPITGPAMCPTTSWS